MEMWQRIKMIRKSAGITQFELAESLGLKPGSTGKWERKERAQVPTEAMRLLICEKYGINKHWLDTGEGDMYATQQDAEAQVVEAIAREYRQGAVFRAAMDAYLSMTPQDRAVMDNFVRRLAHGVSAQQLIDDPESMLSALDNQEAQPDGGERA